MGITLSDRERRFIALLEDLTDATARDCVVDEDRDRVAFVVAPGDMAKAIGPDGRAVERLEERIGREVVLVEDADDPRTFVANALAPAAVYDVTVSRGDETVAYAEVDDADRGVAIGTDGRNIETARVLAARHFDVDDVRLS